MTKEDRRRKLMGATYTTDPQEGIVLGRENEVVRVGYRSAKDQIRELTRAGINLQIGRQEAYAKPTSLNARMYGEIDRTIAKDKIDSLKGVYEEEIQKRKAKEDAKKAESKAEQERQAEAVRKQPGTGDTTQ